MSPIGGGMGLVGLSPIGAAVPPGGTVTCLVLEVEVPRGLRHLCVHIDDALFAQQVHQFLGRLSHFLIDETQSKCNYLWRRGDKAMACECPRFVAAEESSHDGDGFTGVRVRSFLDVFSDEAAAVEVDLVRYAREPRQPPSDRKLPAVDPPIELGELSGVCLASINRRLPSVPDGCGALGEFRRELSRVHQSRTHLPDD